jgi:hypothetical protein
MAPGRLVCDNGRMPNRPVAGLTLGTVMLGASAAFDVVNFLVESATVIVGLVLVIEGTYEILKRKHLR